ncbi:MAG: flagellar motor protein MotB [Nitrospirae bacterium]|nr:MAG: flagellar motor protein MotB [Nitrospirota bacterium]
MTKKKLFQRRREEEAEQWQLAFADMVIQLMCFFVLIAAVSTVDVEQYKTIAQSLGKALGTDIKGLQQKEKDLQDIKKELETVVGSQQDAMAFEVRANGVAIQLKEGVFFSLGKADLMEDAFSILKSVTPSLMNMKYRITIEGHTDNIPMQSAQFPSNWELSAARASAVARFLIEQGFPKEKIQVLGLADTKPLVPNTDNSSQPIPENQAKNRRVVILISQ